MKIADRLEERGKTWRELETLLYKLEDRRLRKAAASDVLRLGELYRSVCSDLMLAEAYDLPRDTVVFLHGLVGRAHNAVYRTSGFRFADWARTIFQDVPRRLRSDRALWLSATLFYGLFVLLGLLAAARPEVALQVVGRVQLEAMEDMYQEAFSSRKELERNDAMMAGFYILHNAGIGLRCFAGGLFLGIGTLYVLCENAIQLGTVFGHMATTPQARNFYTFVTAHGPFELTAIVFSAAAGLRLGYGLIDTGGMSRLKSLVRAAHDAIPTMGVAVILFVFAAFLEGFVSASSLPYIGKAAIALASTLILLGYLLLLGREPRVESAPATEVPLGV